MNLTDEQHAICQAARDLDVGVHDRGCEGDIAFLRGGAPMAELFQLSAEQMREKIITSGTLSVERFEAGLALLSDPNFWAFAGAGIAVWGRRPDTM